MMDSWLT